MNRFFVNYIVGARGDFLIKCLYDGASTFDTLKTLSTFCKVPAPIEYGVKTHGNFDTDIITAIEDFPKKAKSWAELFDTVNRYQLVKIKIVAESFEERIDVLWFALSKTVLNDTALLPHLTIEEIPIPTRDILYANNDYMLHGVNVHIPRVQNMDKEFLHEYDYIVKFEDLFNAEYIRDLYKKINGKSMDYARFRAIEKNIAMQYRLSKSEFYSILKLRHDAYIGTRQSRH
jgi:hypothetical protein